MKGQLPRKIALCHGSIKLIFLVISFIFLFLTMFLGGITFLFLSILIAFPDVLLIPSLPRQLGDV